jgi:hypothetical protein
MLKGSFHTDTNLFWGTLIFVIFSLTMMMAFIGPFDINHSTTVENAGKIRALEFANLARFRLIQHMGNARGDIEYGELQEREESGISDLGLAENYILVEDLRSGEEWEFGDKSGKNVHETFATISAGFLPVEEDKTLLMKKGSEYILSIYRAAESKGSVIVDVYGQPECSEDGKSGDHPVPSCTELSALEKAEVAGKEITEAVTRVKNVEESELMWILAKKDIDAESLVPKGMRFAETGECAGSQKSRLCFRLMGEFISPAKIRAELKNKAQFVSGAGASDLKEGE